VVEVVVHTLVEQVEPVVPVEVALEQPEEI
jgi:hypothetical protein